MKNPGPATSETPHLTPEKPRRRPVLWVLGLLLLGGGAAATFYFMQGETYRPPGTVARLPVNVDGFVSIDFRRIAKNKNFRPLLTALEKAWLGEPRWRAVRTAAKTAPGEIGNAIVAWRGDSWLVLVEGELDRKAIEGALEKQLGWSARTVGGARLFGFGKAPPAYAGILSPGLFIAGSPTLTGETVSVVLASKPGATTDELMNGVLARVSDRAMVFGVLRTAKALAGKLPPFAMPERIAFSIEEVGFALDVRAALAIPRHQDAEAARTAVAERVKASLPALRAEHRWSPELGQLLASLAHEAAWERSGHRLLAKAKVEVERHGLVGFLATFIVPTAIANDRRDDARRELANLTALAATAKALFEKTPKGKRRNARFPASVELTPAQGACEMPGGRIDFQAKTWAHPTWRALGFQPSRTSLFQYAFTSSGKGPKATFTVRGVAYPDCNGSGSVYELTGQAQRDGTVKLSPTVDRSAVN